MLGSYNTSNGKIVRKSEREKREKRNRKGREEKRRKKRRKGKERRYNFNFDLVFLFFPFFSFPRKLQEVLISRSLRQCLGMLSTSRLGGSLYEWSDSDKERMKRAAYFIRT
jgi:hypothetical protein